MSIIVEVRRKRDHALLHEFKHVTDGAASARLTAILTNHPTSELNEPRKSLYGCEPGPDGKMAWNDLRYVVTLPDGHEDL